MLFQKYWQTLLPSGGSILECPPPWIVETWRYVETWRAPIPTVSGAARGEPGGSLQIPYKELKATSSFSVKTEVTFLTL